MTFVTGTYTNANPGPALYAALQTSLVAEGYTLVDTVVISTRTHKVLQAPSNSFGLPWFLDISYPTTGTSTGIKMVPFEDYIVASKLGVRGPYGNDSSSGSPETTYYSRFGDTGYALETNWCNSSSATALDLSLITGSTNYWASITPERVVLMLSSHPTRMSYAGFFTPTADFAAAAGSYLCPLITVTVVASVNSASSTNISGSYAAVTRVPKLTSFNGGPGSLTQTQSWGNTVFVGQLDWAVRGNSGGIIGVGGSLFTGKISISEVPVMLGWSSPSPGGSGALVGVLDGVASGQAAGSAVRGDTVTVGSDTWYLTSPASNHVVLMLEK